MRRIFGRSGESARERCAFIAPQNAESRKKEKTCNCGGEARKVLFVRLIFFFLSSFKWEEHVSTLRFMDQRMEGKKMFGRIISTICGYGDGDGDDDILLS